jgi:hypothetical protein
LIIVTNSTWLFVDESDEAPMKMDTDEADEQKRLAKKRAHKRKMKKKCRKQLWKKYFV